MSIEDRVHFSLAIDPKADPIMGAVGGADGQSREFAGWLGFAAALEELLSPLRGLPAAPAPGPPAGRPGR